MRCSPKLILLLMLVIARRWIELLQERFAGLGKSFFESFRAIALAACPWLGCVFMTTVAARMRVFHRQEIKIFLPVGALFSQWRGTQTHLLPNRLSPWMPACTS